MECVMELSCGKLEERPLGKKPDLVNIQFYAATLCTQITTVQY